MQVYDCTEQVVEQQRRNAVLHKEVDEHLKRAFLLLKRWYKNDGEMAYTHMICELQERQRAKYPPPPPTRQKIPAELRREVFERDQYRCVNCGSYKNLHVDHIKAVAQKGPGAIGQPPATLIDLQTLCSKCNLKKGAKDVA